MQTATQPKMSVPEFDAHQKVLEKRIKAAVRKKKQLVTLQQKIEQSRFVKDLREELRQHKLSFYELTG